jgi:DNA-binding response OmpR family regulator
MDAQTEEAAPEAAQASRVLIADLDPEVLRQTNRALCNAGFDVATAGDAAGAVTLLENRRFDLLVLDSSMFGADGFAVCTAIRGRMRTPVIVSSASAAEADVVRAVNLCADDYVTKPLKERTLLARIRAILRRSAMNDVAALTVDGVVLDVSAQRLQSGALLVPLTPLETVLLRVLLGSPGRAVSAERLALEAWGKAEPEQRHALKQVVYRLRRKLEATAELAGRLETSRNAGYRWRKGGDAF